MRRPDEIERRDKNTDDPNKVPVLMSQKLTMLAGQDDGVVTWPRHLVDHRGVFAAP